MAETTTKEKVHLLASYWTAWVCANSEKMQQNPSWEKSLQENIEGATLVNVVAVATAFPGLPIICMLHRLPAENVEAYKPIVLPVFTEESTQCMRYAKAPAAVWTDDHLIVVHHQLYSEEILWTRNKSS